MQRGEVLDREAQKQAEAKDQMREQMVDRVDLTPTIEAILDGSFKPAVTNAELNQVFQIWPASEEQETPEWEAKFEADYIKAMDIWNRAKVERNSAVSLFISEVWNDPEFTAKRNSFVPTDYDTKSLGYYFNLSTDASDVFDDALDSWMKKRNQNLKKPREEWTNVDKAYYRYKRILRFGNRSGLLRGDDAARFIRNGVGTATEAMFGLTRIITTLVKNHKLALTNEELTELLRKSYGPIVMPFSALNQEIAITLLDNLGLNLDSPIPETNFFHLVMDSDGKPKLTVDHEALFSFRDEKGQSLITKEMQSETTWCPARYSTGNQKDVIREYFEWIIEIAQKYAFPLVEKKDEAAVA